MMIEFGPFTGLDYRPGAVDEKGGLIEAYNVIVNTAGALVRRPGLYYRVTAPTNTVGLYSVGDQVRCLAHHGTSASGLSPTLTLDYINYSGIATSTLKGHMIDSQGKTLALLKASGGATTIHHAGMPGVDSGYVSPVATGFTPEFALIGMEGRAWAFDAGLQKLYYSGLDDATPSRLDVWTSGTESDDPGFLSVGQFAAGSGLPKALGDFGGRLAVIYDDATQVWRLDTDQSRIFKEAAIGGVGTKHANSLSSVGPDIYLLTNAGVRSLTTVTQTLDPQEDPIGSRVDRVVNEYANDTGANGVGLYARRLGCYLLAFGKNVMCLSFTPGKGINGWSRWRLPVEVDYMCEAEGFVWIRSGNLIFSMDPTKDDDDVDASTTAEIPVRWEPVHRRMGGRISANRVVVASTEDVRVQLVTDGRPVADDPPGLPGSVTTTMPDLPGLPATLPGRSPEMVEWTTAKMGQTMSLRGQDDTTSASWRLEICAIHGSLLSGGN